MKANQNFQESQIPYAILAKFGLTKNMIDDMPQAVMSKFLDGKETPVLPVVYDNKRGERIRSYARLALTKLEDGKTDVVFIPQWKTSKLDSFDMLQQQVPVKGCRLVKVNVLTLLYRHMTAVLVIRILRNDYHFAFWKALNEFFDYRCFTRAGAARNTDDKHKDIYNLVIYEFFIYSGYKITTILAYTQVFIYFFYKILAYVNFLLYLCSDFLKIT